VDAVEELLFDPKAGGTVCTYLLRTREDQDEGVVDAAKTRELNLK
jgi:hypothetical protein